MKRRIDHNPFEKKIVFLKDELDLIRKVAEKRQAPKNRNPLLVYDKRIAKRDNIETHLIGLLGEFAIAKLINGAVDTDAYLNGDQDKDFSLYGVTIEVKTLQGYLTFKQMGDFKSDLAALVIYDKCDLSAVRIPAWLRRL